MHIVVRNKFMRMLIALALIYVAWSIFVDITALHKNIDEEALVPCLFYLPPLGIFILGIIIVKLLEWAVVVGVIRRFKKKK